MTGLLMPMLDTKINYNADLLIPPTRNSPRISFNPRSNEWSVSGKSYPSNVQEFYAPMAKWIDNLNLGIIKSCTFRFNFEFFNTASHLFLVKMLMRLKEENKLRSVDVKIFWYYESGDEDMVDSGESLMTIVGLPFEMISYEE